MSLKFIQFRDFEYLVEGNAIPTNVMKTVKVRVIDESEEYLGSLRFGLYKDIGGDSLKECISDIISQNYPTFKSYESEILKIK